MPTCEKHKTVFKHECSECLHERSREEVAEQKAAEKAEKTLKKAKLKQQLPKAKPKAVSDKMKGRMEIYKEVAKWFKRQHPECQIRANENCTGKTEDVHHSAGRIGDNLLDVAKFKSTCRNCHIYIENHPEEAMQRGWSESRLAVNQERTVI